MLSYNEAGSEVPRHTFSICVGLYSWGWKHVQQWASTVSIHPAGGRTHLDSEQEWQTIKSVWVSSRVRSQWGAEWHRSLPLTNHSPAGAQRSSHTTSTIFKQVCFFFITALANYMAAFIAGKSRLVACFLKGNSDLNIKWGSSYTLLWSHISKAMSGCWRNRRIIHHGALRGGDCLPALMLVLIASHSPVMYQALYAFWCETSAKRASK